MDKITLSVNEAANAIGISRTKMYEIIKRDDCDFVVALGGRLLINRKKLEEWIDKQTGGYMGCGNE